MRQLYRSSLKSALFAATSFAALAGAQPAFAQSADEDSVSDDTFASDTIIVTATKREEDAQDVPISITALDTEQIASSGVTGVEDLRGAVPALNVTTAVAGFGLPRIRGIGATGQGPGIENPVAVYVDGVYYGSAFGVLQSLFDTEQVAVLKGPQGTLFGRNATGGLIQIKTLDPTFEPRAKGKIGYGNYDTISGAGFISIPMGDKVAVSISGQYENQGKGFGTNLFNGNDVQDNEVWAGRIKFLFEPTETTKILLSGDFNGRNAVDPAFINYGLNTLGIDTQAVIESMGGDPNHDIMTDTDPAVHSRQRGVSGTIEQEIGDMTLKSVTAWRESKLESYFDPDGTTVRQLVVDNFQLDKQFTQEVNLISASGGALEWVVGGFYMHDKAGLLPYSRLEGLAIAANVGLTGYIDNKSWVELDSWSGFAEGTYALGDATNLTAGIRYTHDKRTFEGETFIYNSNFGASFTVPQTPAELSFGELSWKVSLDHRFSPVLLAYASYNRGFRAGAFGPQVVDGAIPILTPELVDAFEVGIKSDLFDNRVRLNLSGYYNDQSSVQVMQIVSGIQRIYNADGAEIYGIDGDLSVEVTDNFHLFGGFSWTHARYKDFTDAVISIPYPVGSTFSTTDYTYIDSATGNTVANTECLGTFVPPFAAGTQAGRDGWYRSRPGGNCLLRGDASGNKLQNTPEFTASVGGNLDIPSSAGLFQLAGNVYYNGGYVGTPDERVKESSFTTVAASLTWYPQDRLYIKLWGRNLTDTTYRSQIGASNSGDNGYSGAPRTYGLELGFDF